ncbi:MAG: AMP-binding protein [Ardenticatenales bacterium]|nr:AMP-binding protein [Ardenticatenales bacterium]
MPRLTYEQALAESLRDRRTLGAATIARARWRWGRVAVQEQRGDISRLRLAAAALVVRDRLGLAPEERRVGVMLPPGRGGAVVNLALALGGRTSVNLNHTAGEVQIRRMAEMADLRTIVSSRLYLERLGQPALPGRVVLAEDVLGGLSKPAVVWAMLKVIALPSRWLDRARPDDVATIIFSSGTTGDPKGVQLTHRQVLANCGAMVEHVEIAPDSATLLTALPLFHSFGLVPGMWMCLCYGVRIAAHPDPLDATGIGVMAEKSGAGYMISTPTFVRSYMRRVTPEQFKLLRFSVVGAEKCPSELHAAFRAQYPNSVLLEGYGCTELAPVVAGNRPGAIREGTVGWPLPGIEVFTVDPDTLARQPDGMEGLLVARSPARMQGYLGRDDLTAAAFIHGGYNTGDVATIDPEGVITITGRLARFAKVGGEMVPLDNVEGVLRSWLAAHHPDDAVEIAVCAVPDAKRGERLLVLHAGALPISAHELLASLEGMPTLWRPRQVDFHAVEAIPVLGTGKRDLGALKRMAVLLGD